MKLLIPFVSLVSTVFLMACSGSDSGSGGGGTPPGTPGKPGDPTDPLSSCDYVLTKEKIEAYHKRQNAFRIQGSGFNVSCWAEVTTNGQVRRVEAKGHSQFRVYPAMSFLDVSYDSASSYPLVRTLFTPPTETQLKQIVKDLGLPYKEGETLPVDTQVIDYPAWIRFEKGSLFYVHNAVRRANGNTVEILFRIASETTADADLLKRKIEEFRWNQVQAEMLWSPQAELLPRQYLEKYSASTVWSDVQGSAVLYSLVRENERSADSAILNLAIQQALTWKLDVRKLHPQLPELYSFADAEWQAPTIADNTYAALIYNLQYLLKVNPAHSRKKVLDAYELINKYQSDGRESLRAAVDYAEGRSWTEKQFTHLVGVADVLYSEWHSRSWAMSLQIAEKTGYDKAASLFMAGLAKDFKARSLVDSDNAIDFIAVKMAQGLNPSNRALYFKTFDIFRTEYRADSKQAEKTCDAWVLGGKLTAANSGLYFDLIKWLKDTAYVGFEDAVGTITSLVDQRPIDAARVDIFKSIYTWLVDAIYMNRKEAAEKAAQYVSAGFVDKNMLAVLKSYHAWLVDTISMNRKEALEKVENAVVVNRVSAAQLSSLQALAMYYIDSIYLNRKDALVRAEKQLFVVKASPDQIQALKEVMGWLIDTLSISRKEAADKGDAYLVAAYPLNTTNLVQFKDLTNWYVNTLYIQRAETVQRVGDLVFTAGINKASAEVLKAAVTWLTDTVYVNRSEASKKGETYILNHQLTAVKLRTLKQEYEALVNRGKSRSEALKLAEAKVL